MPRGKRFVLADGDKEFAAAFGEDIITLPSGELLLKVGLLYDFVLL